MSRFPLPDQVVVYGIRTRYAAEVAEILARLGHRGAVYVDNLDDGPDRAPIDPVVSPDEVPWSDAGLGVIVPAFAPAVRRTIVDEVRGAATPCFPVLADPTAVLARSASFGEGSIVNAAVVVASNVTIGAFVNVNRSASIGHDDRIEDFVSIGPGSVLMGAVVVGAGALVGGGATLVPEVRVGAHAVVGAGSVVTADVPDGAVVFGNPARVIRTIDPGDRAR